MRFLPAVYITLFYPFVSYVTN